MLINNNNEERKSDGNNADHAANVAGENGRGENYEIIEEERKHQPGNQAAPADNSQIDIDL